MQHNVIAKVNGRSRVVAAAMDLPSGFPFQTYLTNGTIAGLVNGTITASTLVINATDAHLNISPNLRSYAFDYSVKGYIVNPSYKAATGTTGLITFSTLSRTGKYVPSYPDVFYNRIWLIPTSINVDGAPQQYSTTAVVWNSYFSDKTIVSVSPNNLTGVNISGFLTGAFKSLESKTYTISLTSSVSAVVNGFYQFNFSDAEDPILPVTGTISLAFPYKHNWSTDYIETYSLKSGIIESHNGIEQTFKLSANPRRSLSMDVLLADNTGYADISAIRAKFYNSMAYGKSKSWIVPLWADAQILQSSLAAGSLTINTATTNLDFKVGGYIYIYKNYNNYEISTISSLTPTSITLSAATQKTWDSGSYVIPAVQARLQDDSIKGSIINYGIESFNLIWAVIPKDNEQINKIGTFSTVTYNGYPVFLWKHNFIEDPSVEVYSPNRLLDFEVGNFILDPRYNFNRVRSTFSYLLKNKSEISSALGFFTLVSGKQKPFWMPTYSNEIQVTSSGSSSSNIINIKDIGYSSFIKQNPNQRDIILIKTDGTYILRRIVASSGNGDGTEKLTLDQEVGFNWTSATFREGHFLKLVRLDQDSLEVTYATNTIANISFVIVDSMQA